MDSAPRFPPLSRSTSRLKIRDHLNSLMGHNVEHEDHAILFEPPAARSVIVSYENELVHKYLLHRNRLLHQTHVLYFKWWLWIEDDIGRRMDELIETPDQLTLKLKQVHRLNQKAIADRGPPFSFHFMRMGIEPSTSCPLLEHGDCVIMRAEVALGQSFFDYVASKILQDEIYSPMDMSLPVVGVSLITYPVYSMITLWIPPQPNARKYSEDDIFDMLLKLTGSPRSNEIVPSAIVVDNDTAISYEIFY